MANKIRISNDHRVCPKCGYQWDPKFAVVELDFNENERCLCCPNCGELIEDGDDVVNENESIFEYGGYHFVPYRQLSINEKKATLTALTKHLRSDTELGLCKYDWKKHNYSHESFYAASNNSTSDLFRCVENNKVYIPGENELFEFKED